MIYMIYTIQDILYDMILYDMLWPSRWRFRMIQPWNFGITVTAETKSGSSGMPNYHLVNQHSHGIDGPFIDDFPIKTSIYKGFSMAMLNNQRVWIVEIWWHMHPFSCWYYMILPPHIRVWRDILNNNAKNDKRFCFFDFDQLFGHWTSNIWMQPAWTPCNLCRIWVDLLLKVGNIVWSHVVLVQASTTKNTTKIYLCMAFGYNMHSGCTQYLHNPS